MVRNTTRISAIVTNYNGLNLGLLESFFSSFLKDNFRDFELFFVDNASTDQSVEFVESNFSYDKRVKIIKNPVNNMSYGINLALEKAKSKYVLFLNNDIYFAKGTIKKMVMLLDNHKDVALVQGKMVSFFDHNRIDDVGETIDLFGSPNTLGAGEKDNGQYDKQQEVLSVTGAASLGRMKLIRKVGLLDSDFSIGYEDLDLALRLRLMGYQIIYLPQALTFHKRGSSVSNSSNEIRLQIKYGFNKNRLATLIKNYQLSTLLRSLPVVVLIYFATGIFEMFYKKLWEFGFCRFKAIGWMVINLPNLIEKRKKVQRLRVLPDGKAILPFLANDQFTDNIKQFLKSKNW